MTAPVQLTRSIADNYRRQLSIAIARQSFIAANPREGSIQRQTRRAFTANNCKPLSIRELLDWCYPARLRQHWHYTNIYRALKRLGAKRIGWGVYATCARHSK